jgi:hypothetical protein
MGVSMPNTALPTRSPAAAGAVPVPVEGAVSVGAAAAPARRIRVSRLAGRHVFETAA